MFTLPTTPHQEQRSSTWPRYITGEANLPLPPSSFPSTHRSLPTQSPQPPYLSSPSPSSRSHIASPCHTPFSLSAQRQTTPLPTLERDLHTSPMQPAYPNTPPAHTFGINGGLIVSEPGSMIAPTTDCTPVLPAHADVFLSATVPKAARPALRPSLSHNAAVHSTPSPSTWPRRIMTAPAEHEANTPFAAATAPGTSTSAAAATHPSSSHPSHSSRSHSHPAHHYHPYSTHTPPPAPYADDYAYPAPSYGAPSYQPYTPQTAWNMASISHPPPPHHQAPYHWGMHHMAIPTKQDEPILQPGELPAPRPPMSYAALIGEALLLAPPPHQLYVSEISDSVKKRYPYYRQNPTKIYNGVRHQTSMCKAFVKLPRPFGDQSGGARKWAIRAGCETWFSGGGYHPPATPPATAGKTKAGGKAKSTARSKQLVIGTSADDKKIPPSFPSAGSSGGPSSGPAYNGSNGRSVLPYSTQSQAQAAQAAAQAPYSGYASPPQQHNHLPPGYHYVPVTPAQGHPQPQQPIYVPVWGPYAAPNPPNSGYSHASHHAHGSHSGYGGYEGSESQSPEGWCVGGVDAQSSDETHVASYDDVKVLPVAVGSPVGSIHSYQGSVLSGQGSPETL
ncbi:hypothetical protein IAT38_003471 [Cryptococcus sp. DSM 104549]